MTSILLNFQVGREWISEREEVTPSRVLDASNSCKAMSFALEERQGDDTNHGYA